MSPTSPCPSGHCLHSSSINVTAPPLYRTVVWPTPISPGTSLCVEPRAASSRVVPVFPLWYTAPCRLPRECVILGKLKEHFQEHYSDIIMSAMASLMSVVFRCMLDLLFRRRSKKTSKLRATGFRKGNTPVAGGFPSQIVSNADNISIWWRHHEGPGLLINHFEILVVQQGFSNMASDWLAAILPANQKPNLKIYMDFGITLPYQSNLREEC